MVPVNPACPVGPEDRTGVQYKKYQNTNFNFIIIMLKWQKINHYRDIFGLG
jgi:hypothetical protein